jgi:cold shock CspA family protein
VCSAPDQYAGPILQAENIASRKGYPTGHNLSVRTARGIVRGVVERWSAIDGCGVLRAPNGETVFCHYSMIDVDGYQTLNAAEAVVFDYEVPGQDGCDGRVLTFVRPLGESGQ